LPVQPLVREMNAPEHGSLTYGSLTPLYPTCYKDSPFVLRPLCA
jgi:hypothetical protein